MRSLQAEAKMHVLQAKIAAKCKPIFFLQCYFA